MWIFTKSSFLSAVEHRDDPSVLMIRARDKQSLQHMSEEFDTPIVEMAYSDYPYRIVAGKEEFAAWLDGEVHAIDYDNFKDASTRGSVWKDALMDVWAAMRQVTPKSVRRW